jgi:hypothetical protein
MEFVAAIDRVYRKEEVIWKYICSGKILESGRKVSIWVISFASLLIPYLFIGLLHYNTNQLVDTIISLFLLLPFSIPSKTATGWPYFPPNKHLAVIFLAIPFVAIPVWERGIYFSEVFAVVALIKALQMPGY